MSDDEKMNRDLRSYSRSQAIDRTEDYMRRGRALAQVDSARLKEDWIALYRRWCHEVRNYELQRQANDIESELALRREEAPVDAVANEMHALADALKAELMKLDGEQLRRMGERMLGEIDQFRRRRGEQH